MHLDVTLLTEKQILGENRLDIFNKIGTMAPLTDFAILLGAYAFDYNYAGEEKLENRAGYYWTQSDGRNNNAQIVGSNGHCFSENVFERYVACRPALLFSSLSKSATNVVSHRGKNGVIEIDYGNSPQMAVNKEMQKKLENVFQRDELKQTRNHFTVDSRRYDEYSKRFTPKEIIEYEYQGSKYVRVETNHSHYESKVPLSNGEFYRNGDYAWVEVSPVKWFMDEKTGLMISEKLLFAGIQFNHERYYRGEFSKTDIKWYLDKYFAPELMQPCLIEEKELSKKELEQLKLLVQEQKDTIDWLKKQYLFQKEMEKKRVKVKYGHRKYQL